MRGTEGGPRAHDARPRLEAQKAVWRLTCHRQANEVTPLCGLRRTGAPSIIDGLARRPGDAFARQYHTSADRYDQVRDQKRITMTHTDTVYGRLLASHRMVSREIQTAREFSPARQKIIDRLVRIEWRLRLIQRASDQ